MSSDSWLVAGWSRTRVRVEPDDRVLDVGCGSFPNARADVAIDRSIDDDRHRTGRRAVVDRPFVIGDAEVLPIRSDSVDLVIASHIAEHVDDPARFCAELARVARRGYIETPSPLADVLLHEDYHRWRVGAAGGRVAFREKRARSRLVARVTDAFYRFFYAGRPTGEKATRQLPDGLLGKALGGILYVIRGVLNRSGVMHTRVEFGPDRPLRWSVRRVDGSEVVGSSEGGRHVRVLFVERDPISGFMEFDRRVMERNGTVERVAYPGWPSPRFLARCVGAVRRNDVVYAFFASEHALFPGLLARVLRRRFVVTTGGYDTANVPEQRYGLAAQGRGWLPRAVLRCADEILPISAPAEQDLEALDPRALGRSAVLPLALDPDTWSQRDVDRVSGRVVTVGYVDEVSWRRKGIDRFMALAAADPEREYVLAGRVAPTMKAHIEAVRSPNLELVGFLPQEELVTLLWSSEVYVQLSWHEGFGLAVAEAMACGCVPVVSAVPALVDVVGGWGVVVVDGHDRAAVDQALRAGVDRRAMRDDVMRRFSAERRSTGLVRALGLR